MNVIEEGGPKERASEITLGNLRGPQACHHCTWTKPGTTSLVHNGGPIQGLENYTRGVYINTANLESPMSAPSRSGSNWGWPSYLGHFTVIDGKDALLLWSGPPLWGVQGPSMLLSHCRMAYTL